jgi:hypothetical protein
VGWSIAAKEFYYGFGPAVAVQVESVGGLLSMEVVDRREGVQLGLG